MHPLVEVIQLDFWIYPSLLFVVSSNTSTKTKGETILNLVTLVMRARYVMIIKGSPKYSWHDWRSTDYAKSGDLGLGAVIEHCKRVEGMEIGVGTGSNNDWRLIVGCDDVMTRHLRTGCGDQVWQKGWGVRVWRLKIGVGTDLTGAHITSQLHPIATLSQYVKQSAQLSLLKACYMCIWDYLTFEEVVLSSTEVVHPECKCQWITVWVTKLHLITSQFQDHLWDHLWGHLHGCLADHLCLISNSIPDSISS